MKITEIKAIQDLANCVGTDGCYFICLCAVAEKITGKEIDVLRSAWKAIELKLIDYDLNCAKSIQTKCLYLMQIKFSKCLAAKVTTLKK